MAEMVISQSSHLVFLPSSPISPSPFLFPFQIQIAMVEGGLPRADTFTTGTELGVTTHPSFLGTEQVPLGLSAKTGKAQANWDGQSPYRL